MRDRYFLVKKQQNCIPLNLAYHKGSVLGPVFYLVYIADLPLNNNTEVVTSADDTAILALHSDPTKASENLQGKFDKTGMKPSQQVSFTLRRNESRLS